MTGLLPADLLPAIEHARAVAPGQRWALPPLHGVADALALAALAAPERPLLVVTAEAMDAVRLEEALGWLVPQARVHLLPDWETLPYDRFSPHQDLISERLSTLHAISQGNYDIVLVPASTALYRLAPPAFLAAYTFFLKTGERLDLDALRAQMVMAGYEPVSQVVSPGEFSLRGGIVDLFPMGTRLPLRVELFDDEIESIRTFDPDSQRTVYPVDEIRLLPAREFPLDEGARSGFRSRFRETFEGDPSRVTLYKDITQGIAPPGIEYYLPLFFDDTATLPGYLQPDARVVLVGDVNSAIEAFWASTRSRYDLLKGNKREPVLPPEALFLSAEAFFAALKAFPRVQLDRAANNAVAQSATTEGDTRALPTLSIDYKADDPLALLRQFLEDFAGRTLLIADSPGRRETMATLLTEHGIRADAVDSFAAFVDGESRLALAVAPIDRGCVLPGAGMAIVTETELYSAANRSRRRRDTRKATTMEGWLRDLSELKPGDPVVHVAHGIGRYLGLEHMDIGEGDAEFLHLEYDGGAKLYVPVSQLHVITRYAGSDPDSVTLHRLGSGQWEKARKKAAQQVRDTAAELLALYAQRAARQGHRFEFKASDYEAFADGFGFEPTADQQAAIDAVIADMRAGRPMDRLVCGDVGFGKTEVALRAAFIAVADGKQVAVLCPTTLLAEQHGQTFADRFADWPIRVAELSRFKSAKEQSAVIAELEAGKVDIIIGTHRLLQKDLSFKRLGLVIIDEEHRFGVRQKEALKTLRSDVDILTLTATPIPRTLGLALEGMREFSVIATAPSRRLAIKTFVQRYSQATVREAVLREFKRGGQVYFLHNEVETIDTMQAQLEKLLPEARIVVGHGQLPERELERVMRDFTHKRANLLLCTTIIETGIDIPNANTIIINRADRFGLAQLHQLRGRVGRSHHQAYAYLLTHADGKPTPAAQKRLEAIAMMEELGSGFYLAMHDLEIRGAGEILGENQSGEIQQVGFSLYTEMLKRAVRDLQAGKEPDLSQPLETIAEINLHTPALLPNDYCPDIQERLTLYKRLANCQDEAALQAMREELVDRFGTPPTQCEALFESHRLRLAVDRFGVTRLDVSESKLSVQFGPDAAIDAGKVILLLQKDRSLKMAGPERLIQSIRAPQLAERRKAVLKLLTQIVR